jgi:small conductance mechanosensitive channel
VNSFLQSIVSRLQAQFDPAVAGPTLVAMITNALSGVLIFLGFYGVWFIGDIFARAVLGRGKIDETTASFIRTILKFFVLGFGVVQGLSAIGVNTAALVTSLGVAGLTIGFAARDALSNLISGILIFWDRPFVIGDLVEVEGHYGRVDRITPRSTRIVTVDGRMLAVPNSTVINSTVASYTNFPHLRLDIPVTVAVSEDLDRAREVLLGLVTKMPGNMMDPPPQVVVTALNDYNVTLQLRVWIDDEKQHVTKTLELREAMFKALTSAEIEMPFETLQLTPIQVTTEPVVHAAGGR